MASIFSEKYETMSSFESTGLWKRCERCEVKVESWGFVEEGGKQFGKECRSWEAGRREVMLGVKEDSRIIF